MMVIVSMLAVFVAVCIVAVFAWFPKVIVVGDSMFPTLKDGNRLRARRVLPFTKLSEGSIYIFHPPVENGEREGKIVIKRLIYLEGKSCYFLGDNSEVSYDSRAYGMVDRKRVIGKIIKMGRD